MYSLIYTKFYTIMFKVRIVVIFSGDFPGGSNGKASIYNAGDLVLGQEDPLKKKMAILQT